MKNQKDPIWRNAMNFGAIGGVIIALFWLVSYTGLISYQGMSVLRFPVLIVALITGTKFLRDKLLNGYIKYSKALGSGVLISIFFGIIYGFFVYIDLTYVNPKMMDELMRLQEEVLMKMNLIDENQLETMITEMRETTTAMKYAFSEIFTTLFWGFVISIFTSIFLKKDEPISNNIITED